MVTSNSALDQAVAPGRLGTKLSAHDVVVRFGGVEAIGGVSLDVPVGVVTGLIGPNGAGKTTLVNVLTGFQKPTSGSVTINDGRIDGMAPESFARAGIARTFQNVRLYRGMSVTENLIANGIGAGLPIRDARTTTRDILRRLDLFHLAEVRCDTLSYAYERRVGIARALAGNPAFLLLDEPAAGMTESECDALSALIFDISRTFGCGVLLIEHNMRVVMATCDRINVIVFGRKIAEGTPSYISDHKDVRDAYLG